MKHTPDREQEQVTPPLPIRTHAPLQTPHTDSTRSGAAGVDRIGSTIPAHAPATGVGQGSPLSSGSNMLHSLSSLPTIGPEQPSDANAVSASQGTPTVQMPSVSAGQNNPYARSSMSVAETPAPHAPSHAGGSRFKEPGTPKRKHRGLKIGLGIVGGALVITYVAGVIAFSQLYYPGTFIADQDISLKQADDAAALIEDSLANYQLDIEGDGITFTFRPASGAFSVDADQAAQDLLAQNEPLAWPLRLAQSVMVKQHAEHAEAQPSGINVNYDEQELERELGAIIDEMNQTRTGTFDSAGAYDETAGKFTVERARSNQKLNRDAIIAAAKDAVEHLSNNLELDDTYYAELAGGATDEELQRACDQANQIIGVNVTLTMGGTEVAKLDGKQLMQWITFDENLTPKLDSQALAPWIKNLAGKLDTVGTERTYTRADGKKITVKGGTWGWISDEAKLAEMLQQAVDNKQQGTIEVPTKSTADTYQGLGARDWGAYVDIDLTEQHVRYYDANDQLIWESGCISGNPNKGNATPTGIYKLNSNKGGATLIGKKDPETGKPEYETPVKYWMPFIGNSVGLHDADWQAASSFSDPNAYTWAGSHGCINLPPDKAAELSGMLKVGTCIITHY